MMDKGLLEEAAKRAGVELTAAMLEQTICYVDLLREANRKMNLTSIINDEPVARLHFEDSWRAAAHIPQGVHLIDVGTGAGFPGMALALVRPDLRVTLLDATLKKVKFLQEVTGQLELDRVTAVQGRAEELGRTGSFRDQFDLALARALTALPVLVELCLPFVKAGGCLIAMKGEEDETKEAARAICLLKGSLEQVVHYSLPGTDKPRSLVLIKKTGPTPSSYPRRMAVIKKAPL